MYIWISVVCVFVIAMASRELAVMTAPLCVSQESGGRRCGGRWSSGQVRQRRSCESIHAARLSSDVFLVSRVDDAAIVSAHDTHLAFHEKHDDRNAGTSISATIFGDSDGLNDNVDFNSLDKYSRDPRNKNDSLKLCYYLSNVRVNFQLLFHNILTRLTIFGWYYLSFKKCSRYNPVRASYHAGCFRSRQMHSTSCTNILKMLRLSSYNQTPYSLYQERLLAVGTS